MHTHSHTHARACTRARLHAHPPMYWCVSVAKIVVKMAAAGAAAAAAVPPVRAVPGGVAPGPPPVPAAGVPPPPLQLRQAVPGPPVKRKRGSAHWLWPRFRLLPASEGPFTHECLSCQKRIVCPKNNNSFVNSPAKRHFEKAHAEEFARLERGKAAHPAIERGKAALDCVGSLTACLQLC